MIVSHPPLSYIEQISAALCPVISLSCALHRNGKILTLFFFFCCVFCFGYFLNLDIPPFLDLFMETSRNWSILIFMEKYTLAMYRYHVITHQSSSHVLPKCFTLTPIWTENNKFLVWIKTVISCYCVLCYSRIYTLNCAYALVHVT